MLEETNTFFHRATDVLELPQDLRTVLVTP
jgi:hypothetical protein